MTTTAIPRAAGAPPLRHDAAVIGLVGVAHMMSHFSQLLLAPLFPWLKTAFNVSYAELGFLLSVFFVVSCAVQATAGFVVDRYGPRPALLGGLGLLGVAALGFASSTHYLTLLLFAVVAGVGNGVFHPVDYTVLNRKVSPSRLGHAYSVHGVTGSLGWALAPAMLVPLATLFGWRTALLAAAGLIFAVLALVFWQRDRLELPAAPVPASQAGAPAESALGFLRIPAVWMCFGFFFFYAAVLSVVQTFAPAAAGHLTSMAPTLAALCLTVYMVASAAGMVAGGFLVADASRAERVVGAGFGVAALFALGMALLPVPGALVPALFAGMGFVTGVAGPSRDMLVKRSTPDNATGRVYGVVYAGLDIGQAVMPLLFGALMDHGQYRAVWFGLAALQGVLIASAFNVRRVRRTPSPVLA